MKYKYDENGFIDKKSWAYDYSYVELMEMLKSEELDDIRIAMSAFAIRRDKDALDALRNLALYDEDKSIQIQAIETIRIIGGDKARDILQFLKTTEYKKYIEEDLEDDR